MIKPDNSNVKTWKFMYQLTMWLPLKELEGACNTIHESEGEDSYGKYYCIKRHPNNGKRAVFTKGTHITEPYLWGASCGFIRRG